MAPEERLMPLHITATLGSPIALQAWLPLDGLLMALEARRLQLPPPELGGLQDVAIPVLRHSSGLYHASFGRGQSVPGSGEVQMRRRRFPIREAATLGKETIGKVPVNMGPLKSVNLPLYTRWVPCIEWWCIGDKAEVESLLEECGYLGKERNHGYGRVERWQVEECAEDWSLFYPCDRPDEVIVSRVLPAAFPECAGRIGNLGLAVPTPPYWQPQRVEMCYLPEEIR